MSAPLPQPATARIAPTPAHPERRHPPARDRGWPTVRITDVVTEAAGHALPEGHRRVRAEIHLGRLTPADVEVHLTTGRARCADVAPGGCAPGAWALRLTCSRAFGNGTFTFEGHVAEPLLERPELLAVVVEPHRRFGDGGLPGMPATRRLAARPLVERRQEPRPLAHPPPLRP